MNYTDRSSNFVGVKAIGSQNRCVTSLEARCSSAKIYFELKTYIGESLTFVYVFISPNKQFLLLLSIYLLLSSFVIHQKELYLYWQKEFGRYNSQKRWLEMKRLTFLACCEVCNNWKSGNHHKLWSLNKKPNQRKCFS